MKVMVSYRYHRMRLCVLLLLCLNAGDVCAADHEKADVTEETVGLIKAAFESDQQWLSTGELQQLYDALTAEQPALINPFAPRRAFAPIRVLHDRMNDLLSTGAVDHPKLVRWLADILRAQQHQQKRTDEDIQSTQYVDSEMYFATAPPGQMTLPRFLGAPYQAGPDMIFPDEFEIMTTPVTQAMWFRWMGTVPFYHTKGESCRWVDVGGRRLSFNPQFPAESVDEKAMALLINTLNVQNDDYLYRLPTEAEWIYIYTNGGQEINRIGWKRVGAQFFTEDRLFGNAAGTAPDGGPSGNFAQYGWVDDNANNQLHPVRQKTPLVLTHPTLGDQKIWDMVGNVHERVVSTLSRDGVFASGEVALLGGSYRSRCHMDGSSLNPWDNIATGGRNVVHPISSVGFRLVRQRRVGR